MAGLLVLLQCEVLLSGFQEAFGIANNHCNKKAIQRLEDLRIIFRVKGIPRISNPYFGLWIKKKLRAEPLGKKR